MYSYLRGSRSGRRWQYRWVAVCTVRHSSISLSAAAAAVAASIEQHRRESRRYSMHTALRQWLLSIPVDEDLDTAATRRLVRSRDQPFPGHLPPPPQIKQPPRTSARIVRFGKGRVWRKSVIPPLLGLGLELLRLELGLPVWVGGIRVSWDYVISDRVSVTVKV